MKIAQLAPPWLPVPPTGYGGTELIVHSLTEELVKRGHDVTLFASGDSKTSAKLSSVFEKALGNSGAIKGDALHPLLHYIECFEKAEQFDIIHNHAQYYAMFLADLVKTPFVHTIHGSYSKESTPEEKIHTLKRFRDHNFISISNNQRNDLPELNYVATVYNGIDLSEFPFIKEQGKYLLWFGRITAKKGPVDAIEAANSLGLPLKLVGAIDPIEQEYFDSVVKPLIDGKLITYEGEISVFDKAKVYEGAICTLYPIHWEEPFGLVMAESMASGTPVVAYNRGSVSELVEDGITGFIIRENPASSDGYRISEVGVAGLVAAVKRIGEISREACRKRIEENFTVEKMVDGYEAVYKKLLNPQH